MQISIASALLVAASTALGAPPDSGSATASAQDPPAFVLVEGQVTTHVGAGHAGVGISVSRKDEGDLLGEPIAKTTSDGFGDFAIKLPKPIRGDFVVIFRAEGYAQLKRDIQVGDDEFPPFLAETLPGKYVVIGRVVSAAGQEPVSGASVNLTASSNAWHEKTDDRGMFTIKGVLPGRGELVVEAKGFGRERLTVPMMEDFGEIVVSLKPQRVVRIKVVDDKGDPIAAATIEAIDQAHDDFRTTITDASGDAVLDGWHFDTALIGFRLTHEDYVSGERFDREIITPENETESAHELVMVRAGRIAGRITDASAGDPVNGARVLTGKADADARPRDWSDYQGQFAVTGVTPGRVVVTIHRSCYAPELKTVEVHAGETAQLDVLLQKGAALKGVVRNVDGDPVPGAYVETLTWRGHKTLDLRAITDGDGRFVIEDAPYDEFEISVFASQRGAGAVTRKVKADTQVEIAIPVSEVAGLRGGGTAPVVTVTTLDGEKLDLKKLRGKIIVLDFWATWCAPCVAELPHLKAVHDRFSKRNDFVLISVSLDGDEKAFRAFVAKRKLNWHHVFGESGGAQQAADRYGVEGLPALFVIGPGGKIIGRDWHGADLLKKIEQVLKDNDPT